jgi:transcriptional regulator with XRE-family HTH domain
VHVAQWFEHLLESHGRLDGSRWTGQQLDEATAGIVTCSYVTNLRKGRIESPGYEKMLAIARAMGFPPGAWFEDVPGHATRASAGEGLDLAARVGCPFEVVRHPGSGEPYPDAAEANEEGFMANSPELGFGFTVLFGGSLSLCQTLWVIRIEEPEWSKSSPE